MLIGLCKSIISPLTPLEKGVNLFIWNLNLSSKVVYIMDHGVVPYQRAFRHGHTSMVWFLKNAFWKSLCYWLGVNQTMDVLLLFNICLKMAVLIIFSMFDLFPSSSPLLSCNYENFRAKINKKLKRHFSAMVPWHLQQGNLYCLSHRKTCWTMTMDNTYLKIGFLGTSSFMVTLTFSFWCKPKWSWDEFNNQSPTLEEQGMTNSHSMM